MCLLIHTGSDLHFLSGWWERSQTQKLFVFVGLPLLFQNYTYMRDLLDFECNQLVDIDNLENWSLQESIYPSLNKWIIISAATPTVYICFDIFRVDDDFRISYGTQGLQSLKLQLHLFLNNILHWVDSSDSTLNFISNHRLRMNMCCVSFSHRKYSTIMRGVDLIGGLPP